ncbi:zinc-binding dehydrogenase [Micromonospora sp. NPDC003944]
MIESLGTVPIDHTSTSVEEHVQRYTSGEGFDIVMDNVGGATLDASFAAVRTYHGHVVGALGWGSHSLAPLSFRGATYSGVVTLLPMLTGRGRERHGVILREIAALADGRRAAPPAGRSPVHARHGHGRPPPGCRRHRRGLTNRGRFLPPGHLSNARLGGHQRRRQPRRCRPACDAITPRPAR